MRGGSASLFFLAAVLIASASFSKCSRSGSEYKVVLSDAFQLKRGSQVQYAGVPVGKVEAISLRSSGSGATSQVVVTVFLKPGNYQVREGDRFQVSSAGLLGENYIDVVPNSSTASPLPPGATVQGDAPLSFSSVKGLSSFLDLLGLAAKLNTLPEPKREEVIKTLHRVVDEAAEVASPTRNPGSAPVRKD